MLYLLKKIKFEILYRSHYYLFKYKKGLKNYIIDDEWKKRIEDTCNCIDNQDIPRSENAGIIKGNYQIMHNDIKIMLGSYYGFGYSKLIEKNKGVHEPQEEKVFQEVLKCLPENSTMIELGSYWAFYSIWFNKEIKNANSYLIEPDPLSLIKGKINFKINNCKGHFFNAFVGEKYTKNLNNAPTYCIDDFIEKHKIQHVNILHSDIQGFELDMLKGARKSIKRRLIDYLFISTHSNELHQNCTLFLLEHGYEIIASADLDQSYSVDGLLVAKLLDIKENNEINISKKN